MQTQTFLRNKDNCLTADQQKNNPKYSCMLPVDKKQPEIYPYFINSDMKNYPQN